MTYQGIACDRGTMTRQQCDECVQQPDHPCPFNAKLLAMLWGDRDHEPSSLTFSPTRLIGCPRAKYLEAHHYPKYLDPYKGWNALRGTMAHGFFEGTAPGPSTVFEICEERFETTVETAYGPQKFVGKPDLVEVLADDGWSITVKITDWKSIKDIGHDMLEAKEAHQKQVNMYAFLLQEALPGYLNRPDLLVEVAELEIIYFDMGKVRRFTSKGSVIDRGKLLTPRSAGRHAPLELEPIKQKSRNFMRDMVATLIEDAIEAMGDLAPAYEGDQARLCPYCPLYKSCAELQKEGR